MKSQNLISPLRRFLYAYPVLMLFSLYTTWLVAWVVLGHQPRPSIDDPKYISALVDIPYFVSMLLIMAIPGAMLMGIGLTLLHLRAQGNSNGALVPRTTLALLILAAI